MHDVDVARAQIGQTHVVVGDDPEDDLVEPRLRGVEVVGRSLHDDPVLGHPLGELPRAHADRGGAELVAELLDRRR